MKLQHTWVSWIQNHVSDGFQVKLVFQELERLGFDLTKHPALIQRFLKRQKSGSASDYSPPYCFTHALRQNNAGRVQCYLAGGFDPNAPLFDATTQQHIRPLHQAAKLGFLSVVKTLLTSKCQVNARDAFGRTALFGAVQSNQLEVVTYLCQEAKASLTTVDNLGNTCLHVAAKNGHASMVNFLLTYHHDCIRKVLVNDIPVTQEDPVHTSFATIVRETYEAMIAKYVSRREKRHFDEAWIYEAIKWIYEVRSHHHYLEYGGITYCSSCIHVFIYIHIHVFIYSVIHFFTYSHIYIPTYSHARKSTMQKSRSGFYTFLRTTSLTVSGNVSRFDCPMIQKMNSQRTIPRRPSSACTKNVCRMEILPTSTS